MSGGSLAEFLLARITEDEGTAREAIDHPDDDLFDSPHQARWWPPRVLAECDAKRRIVEEHGDVDPCDAHDGATLESVDCDTLRFLAAVYADHPDYHEEWRP